jgi:hypothetical protein
LAAWLAGTSGELDDKALGGGIGPHLIRKAKEIQSVIPNYIEQTLPISLNLISWE